MRDVDSEYKFFEFAATVAKDGQPHTMEILSERTMCESCQQVMAEFKRRYPNVKVSVVSNKKERAAKSKNRNIAFDFDVKRRYTDENNK